MENNILPIEHLSYSSLRTFCSNQQQWYKNYIMGIWDNVSSPAAVVGKAGHKTLEHWYKTHDRQAAVEAGFQYINSVNDKDIDFGKTGSRENILKEFNAGINFFFAEEPDFGKVIAAEKSLITDIGFKGEPLPLPVKAISDLITEKNGKLLINDYKFVISFCDPEEEQPEKIMQAMFNFLTVKAKYGKEPYSMTYWEVKKSQNRDGSPQVVPYEIVFENLPQYKTAFNKMYKGFILSVIDENHQYLPNISDMYNGKEAWKDFISDTIEVEKIDMNITHRPVSFNPIREVKYVESQVDTKAITREDKIKAKLVEFGIAVSMETTYEGANVTLFTLKPSRGVKMSQFLQLSADLALALEAKSVRVEAPIPGTGLIGVEVSNNEQKIVNYDEKLIKKDTLLIPIGQDVYGKDRHLDLTKAPHLLIAGATGSGKSVCMDVIIHSLIHQMSDKDLQLILVDPKRTEFVEYEDDSHLSAPVITEIVDVDATLAWAVKEMDIRYKKLKGMRVKNIFEYRKNALDMPYIVIIIDELSDVLLSSVKKQVENVSELNKSSSGNSTKTKITNIPLRDEIEINIIRLAQKARAVGIHMILATQRPSVDVVTGLIKANLPARLSFMVSSSVDSKVILDDSGAEKLIGNGDCLLLDPSKQGLERLQGYFIK